MPVGRHVVDPLLTPCVQAGPKRRLGVFAFPVRQFNGKLYRSHRTESLYYYVDRIQKSM